MRALKLKKNEYYDLPALLTRAKLVNNGVANPSAIYVNKKTAKAMHKAMMAYSKKQNKHYNEKSHKLAVGMEWLNLGPCEIDDGIKDGYAIVLD